MTAPRDEDTRLKDRAARLAELQRWYADALLRGDETGAELVVRDAMDVDFAEAEIDEAIIAPALRLVGDLWESGEIDIAEEHHATEISLRVLALQREAYRVARRRAQHRVLLAAVEGEQHVVGLRMAGSLLLHAGYDVRLLGADLPMDALRSAVRRHTPTLVGLTATLASSIERLPRAIDAVHAGAPGAAVLLGGDDLPSRLAAVPDVSVCRHVTDAVGLAEALVQRASAN